MRLVECRDFFRVKSVRKLSYIRRITTDNGLTIRFGERPSKRGSRRYKLSSITFDKKFWTGESAVAWWFDHQIFFVPKEKQGKKLPPCDFWLSNIDGKGTFLFACKRNAAKEYTVKEILEK